MLEYDVFVTRVIEMLDVDCPVPVNPSVELYDELGLDSLQAFQLLVLIESMAAVDVPPPDLPEIYTMQDAYDYYGSLVAVG